MIPRIIGFGICKSEREIPECGLVDDCEWHTLVVNPKDSTSRLYVGYWGWYKGVEVSNLTFFPLYADYQKYGRAESTDTCQFSVGNFRKVNTDEYMFDIWEYLFIPYTEKIPGMDPANNTSDIAIVGKGILACDDDPFDECFTNNNNGNWIRFITFFRGKIHQSPVSAEIIFFDDSECEYVGYPVNCIITYEDSVNLERNSVINFERVPLLDIEGTFCVKFDITNQKTDVELIRDNLEIPFWYE